MKILIIYLIDKDPKKVTKFSIHNIAKRAGKQEHLIFEKMLIKIFLRKADFLSMVD